MASRKLDKGNRKKDRLPRRLFKQERGPAIARGHKGVSEPAGQQKMSDVLEDFVAPYGDMAQTEDAYRKLLSLGMLAWNIALFPEDQRRAHIDEALEAGFPTAAASYRAGAREFIEKMIRRKLEHFAANQRAILSLELKNTRDGFHLTVASTL